MTTLVRWTPFRELDLVERNMRRIMEPFGFVPSMLPPADVYETKDEFVLELDVPGFTEKELDVEVTDHLLTIKGERVEAKEEADEKSFRLHERLEAHFERRFELPHDAVTGKVKAVFKDGVLEVRAPRVKEAVPKRIAIGKG